MWEKSGRSPLESWELCQVGTTFSVHKFLGEGGKWFVTCERMGLRSHDLGTENLEAAKELAVGLLMAESIMIINEAKRLHSKLADYQLTVALDRDSELMLEKSIIFSKDKDGCTVWSFRVQSERMSTKRCREIAQEIYNKLTPY